MRMGYWTPNFTKNHTYYSIHINIIKLILDNLCYKISSFTYFRRLYNVNCGVVMEGQRFQPFLFSKKIENVEMTGKVHSLLFFLYSIKSRFFLFCLNLKK